MSDFSGIARSPAFLAVLKQASLVASVPRPVLITGERGVGKELVARFIHQQSPRREQPFVPVN